MRHTQRVLTDDQWGRIAPLLPPHRPCPNGGRPWAADRECLEGILWLLRSGARWRDIPIDLPSGSTCWRRLRDWAGEGVLPDIHADTSYAPHVRPGLPPVVSRHRCPLP
jgi:transposase